MFALRFSALAALAAAKVQELTDANFHQTVQGEVPVFIKFYAPWCGHCKRLAPDWDKLAEAIDESEMIIAKVDCTVESKTGQEMKVRGYPTIQLLANNMVYDYNGPRNLEALEQWAKGGWKSASGKNVPWNESTLDVAKEYVMEYVQKLSQIMSFEPTIMPLCFALGCVTTLFLQWLCTSGEAAGAAAAPKPPVKATKAE